MTYVTDVIKEHSLSHLLAIKCFTVLTRTAHLSYLPSVLRPPLPFSPTPYPLPTAPRTFVVFIGLTMSAQVFISRLQPCDETGLASLCSCNT